MKKGSFTNFILVLMLIAGLSLMLYPSFSDWWNSIHQSRAVASYVEKVAQLDDDHYRQLWEQATAYNAALRQRANPYNLTDEQREEYYSLLDLGDNGIMGYIDIPSINVFLPIYHGTDEVVLQVAIGHLEWTSLPAGGPGSHCVVSGHRGLPSARLFTDLDQLAVGDLFMIHVLDEVLTYEIDQVKIVEPHETEDLLIEDSKDLCTLVTCTPYGVNSHRMLVRGHRTDNIEQAHSVRITADAVVLEALVVAPFILIPFLLLTLLALLLPKPKKNRRNKK